MKTNQKGFGVVEVLIILVVVSLIAGTGWYVMNKKKAPNKTNVNATTQQEQQSATIEEVAESKPDANASYLVINEWGLRFKTPNGLADVTYTIHSDTVALYAKPVGANVQYRSDHEIFEDGHPRYATGTLYRSTESSKDKIGYTVDGKKLGNFYYYTGWAFSSLATGAACVGLYGDSESNCEPESKAFQLINQGDTALLNTIELSQ
jgi:hypothetical protein